MVTDEGEHNIQAVAGRTVAEGTNLSPTQVAQLLYTIGTLSRFLHDRRTHVLSKAAAAARHDLNLDTLLEKTFLDGKALSTWYPESTVLAIAGLTNLSSCFLCATTNSKQKSVENCMEPVATLLEQLLKQLRRHVCFLTTEECLLLMQSFKDLAVNSATEHAVKAVASLHPRDDFFSQNKEGGKNASRYFKQACVSYSKKNGLLPLQAVMRGESMKTVCEEVSKQLLGNRLGGAFGMLDRVVFLQVLETVFGTTERVHAGNFFSAMQLPRSTTTTTERVSGGDSCRQSTLLQPIAFESWLRSVQRQVERSFVLGRFLLPGTNGVGEIRTSAAAVAKKEKTKSEDTIPQDAAASAETKPACLETLLFESLSKKPAVFSSKQNVIAFKNKATALASRPLIFSFTRTEILRIMEVFAAGLLEKPYHGMKKEKMQLLREERGELHGDQLFHSLMQSDAASTNEAVLSGSKRFDTSKGKGRTTRLSFCQLLDAKCSEFLPRQEPTEEGHCQLVATAGSGIKPAIADFWCRLVCALAVLGVRLDCVGKISEAQWLEMIKLQDEQQDELRGRNFDARTGENKTSQHHSSPPPAASSKTVFALVELGLLKKTNRVEGFLDQVASGDGDDDVSSHWLRYVWCTAQNGGADKPSGASCSSRRTVEDICFSTATDFLEQTLLAQIRLELSARSARGAAVTREGNIQTSRANSTPSSRPLSREERAVLAVLATKGVAHIPQYRIAMSRSSAKDACNPYGTTAVLPYRNEVLLIHDDIPPERSQCSASGDNALAEFRPENLSPVIHKVSPPPAKWLAEVLSSERPPANRQAETGGHDGDTEDTEQNGKTASASLLTLRETTRIQERQILEYGCTSDIGAAGSTSNVARVISIMRSEVKKAMLRRKLEEFVEERIMML
ncbi:unnamed protein product [Amoebophrya sp. A120]|nr:unnamed protein product [Amoebophrya sp. A120]|eukprot:GSA120T00009468001.1